MHLLMVQEFKNVKHTLWINQINVYKQAQKEHRSATTVATFKAGFLIARINMCFCLSELRQFPLGNTSLLLFLFYT